MIIVVLTSGEEVQINDTTHICVEAGCLHLKKKIGTETETTGHLWWKTVTEKNKFLTSAVFKDWRYFVVDGVRTVNESLPERRIVA